MTPAPTTGIRMGVMQPDPVPVVLEATCPGCKRGVRGMATGHVGEETSVVAQCGECGKEFSLTATARGLDS